MCNWSGEVSTPFANAWLELIIKSYLDKGKPRPTEQQIAEYWVREGMPRDDGKGSKTPVYNKNGDIEASDTGNTRKYVQTFNIMG